jgi:hypothetical protein
LNVDLVHNKTLKISIGEGKDDVEVASSVSLLPDLLIYCGTKAKANLFFGE